MQGVVVVADSALIKITRVHEFTIVEIYSTFTDVMFAYLI